MSLTFSPYWYLLFFSFLAGWFLIMVLRRKTAIKDLKGQAVFGLLALLVAVTMEVFAVTTNLWSYTPSNWPLILWPTYVAAALFGYQLMLGVGEKFRENSISTRQASSIETASNC